MKANEFFKVNGIIKCRRITEDLIDQGFDGDFCTKLKQIIEAHELVEVGLPELKEKMFSDSKTLDDVKNWILTVSESLLTNKGLELKKAIKLVESCQ